MKSCVRLYRRVEKKDVPFKGELPGVVICRRGKCIRITNQTEAGIMVGDALLKPARHVDVVTDRTTVKINDETEVIARLM